MLGRETSVVAAHQNSISWPALCPEGVMPKSLSFSRMEQSTAKRNRTDKKVVSSFTSQQERSAFDDGAINI